MIYLIAVIGIPLGILSITLYKAGVGIWLLLVELIVALGLLFGMLLHLNPRRSVRWLVHKHRRKHDMSYTDSDSDHAAIFIGHIIPHLIDLKPYSQWMAFCNKGMTRFKEEQKF